jgi:STAS-like domain of unknown function (DUF4325)
MDKIIIKIADDYTKTPGVREEIEGDFPGEEFLEKILLPRFKQAIAEKKKLYVDLDDTAGYATSFLESAFGGLAREYKDHKIVLVNLELKSDDDPFLIDDINEYIKDANNK